MTQKWPNHPDNPPAYIPVLVSRLSEDGSLIGGSSHCLLLDQTSKQFDLDGSPSDVWTFFNNFSAPVTIDCNYTLAQQKQIICSNGDSFCRYFSCFELVQACILSQYDDDTDRTSELLSLAVDCVLYLLTHEKDAAFLSQCLTVPDLEDCLDKRAPYNVEKMFKAREKIAKHIADACSEIFLRTYHDCMDRLGQSTGFVSKLLGPRKLKYTCLFYLSFTAKDFESLCVEAYKTGATMTDKLKSLGLMRRWNLLSNEDYLDDFTKIITIILRFLLNGFRCKCLALIITLFIT